MTRRLAAHALSLGYGPRDVVRALDLEVPAGRITTIVGPNACGKSTLLRGLARLLPPRSGSVTLDGTALDSMRTIDIARVLGLLPQTPVAPDGISVGDLVGRGRYPHQGWFRRWNAGDDGAVADALERTGTAELVSTGDIAQNAANTTAWFVAFAPANNPKVAIAVMLPNQGQGGANAAPIAKRVLQAAL